MKRPRLSESATEDDTADNHSFPSLDATREKGRRRRQRGQQQQGRLAALAPAAFPSATPPRQQSQMLLWQHLQLLLRRHLLTICSALMTFDWAASPATTAALLQLLPQKLLSFFGT